MRRISVQYAKPDMILARPLYDGYGHTILNQGARLSAEWVQVLGNLPVAELFIADERADDLMVSPLISTDLEGAAAEALGRFMASVQVAAERARVVFGARRVDSENAGSVATYPLDAVSHSADPTRILQLVSQMVEQVVGTERGEPTLAGCHSAKDYDYVLPVRIAGLALWMGKAAELNDIQLLNLGTAAMLQNIGYVRVVPRELTQRPGVSWEELAFMDSWRTEDDDGSDMKTMLPNESEMGIISKHPEDGAEILRGCHAVNAEVIDIVLQHHERWNGGGYPKGLEGNDISVSARILAIADTCCTIASKRPYRQAFPPYEAGELVVACSGGLFDPDLVQIFMEQVPLFPVGVMVKLNTGEIGIVADSNVGLVNRPVVRVCYGPDSSEVETPYDVDLSDEEYENVLVTKALDY
jgi:HD-GYP domain-containing protein (c-di-GMP phosphodiesterase class II)